MFIFYRNIKMQGFICLFPKVSSFPPSQSHRYAHPPNNLQDQISLPVTKKKKEETDFSWHRIYKLNITLKSAFCLLDFWFCFQNPFQILVYTLTLWGNNSANNICYMVAPWILWSLHIVPDCGDQIISILPPDLLFIPAFPDIAWTQRSISCSRFDKGQPSINFAKGVRGDVEKWNLQVMQNTHISSES
jgi:hypothetical protein